MTKSGKVDRGNVIPWTTDCSLRCTGIVDSRQILHFVHIESIVGAEEWNVFEGWRNWGWNWQLELEFGECWPI